MGGGFALPGRATTSGIVTAERKNATKSDHGRISFAINAKVM